MYFYLYLLFALFLKMRKGGHANLSLTDKPTSGISLTLILAMKKNIMYTGHVFVTLKVTRVTSDRNWGWN